MSRIVPTFDSRGFEAQADRVHADLIRAAVRAVNATALRVLDGLRVSMEEHLDAPKPKTLDGLVFEKARVGKTPTATISVKPEVADYLQYAVVGGTRTDMIIPSADAPLDSHGNLRRGYLRAVEARGGFWMVASSGVPTLFEPDGMGGIRAVAFRVDRVDYDPIWPFEDDAAVLVAKILPEEIGKAFERVLSSD